MNRAQVFPEWAPKAPSPAYPLWQRLLDFLFPRLQVAWSFHRGGAPAIKMTLQHQRNGVIVARSVEYKGGYDERP